MSRDLFSPDVVAYLHQHATGIDEVQQSLIDRTAELGPWAQMQIGANQGVFLEILIGAIQPQLAVEIGTFTGYSALSIARALPAGGRLLCCDINDEWAAIGREHWERAGVADRIDLRIAPATTTLAALPDDTTIDFAFIDADKTGYLDYFEAILPRLSDRGVIAVDNTLWALQVLDESDTTDDTVALRHFNETVANDERVRATIVPIGDGVTLINRR